MKKIRIKKVCLVCGKMFTVTPSRGYAKYCSYECANKRQSRNNLEKVCVYCSKLFVVSPANSKRKFCSCGCSKEYHRENNRIEKICKYCGEKFFVYQSETDRKFCSKKCYDKSLIGKRTAEKIKRVCLHCERVFFVGRNGKHRKYCGQDCYAKSQKGKKRISTKIKVICQMCGKEFEVYPFEIRNERKYCSYKCYWKSLTGKERENTKVEIVCLVCGKEFKVSPFEIRKGRRFCSFECANKWQRRDRAEKICQYCGKKFFVISSQNFLKFCSRECYFRDKRGRPARVGGIEKVFEKNILKKIDGLNYEPQKYMESFTGFVDFFLSDYGIIIECDEHHHRLSRQKEKDVSRDFTSEFLYQYETIRFWEHEIRESPKKCIGKIKRFVNRKRAIMA